MNTAQPFNPQSALPGLFKALCIVTFIGASLSMAMSIITLSMSKETEELLNIGAAAQVIRNGAMSSIIFHFLLLIGALFIWERNRLGLVLYIAAAVLGLFMTLLIYSGYYTYGVTSLLSGILFLVFAVVMFLKRNNLVES